MVVGNRSNFSKVLELHLAKRQSILDHPIYPTREESEFRLQLISSELVELATAMGYNMDIFVYSRRGDALLFVNAPDGTHSTAYNVVDTADALGDLLYVVYSAAAHFGLPMDAIFEEIHQSNMTKVIVPDGPENQTLLKGTSYKKPDLHAVLREFISKKRPIDFLGLPQQEVKIEDLPEK
jgi:predicted HAD superfamily Cof-like phosphohydrolase